MTLTKGRREVGLLDAAIVFDIARCDPLEIGLYSSTRNKMNWVPNGVNAEPTRLRVVTEAPNQPLNDSRNIDSGYRRIVGEPNPVLA